jgi:alkanesulfonate monooxygenase SsuD/methylene tetrahydromethanopterin reductase-like flavin-dependent oxidoreductase (luciferase family)
MGWLDPLLALTYAASATTRVRLGTSILVMPTRNPLLLAKEIATLQALSDDRFVLGAGTGWDAREFEALGIPRSERGSRTDEAISVVRQVLSGQASSHAGPAYGFHDVVIGPPPPTPLQVWVAGGQQLARPESPEPPAFAPAVLARIVAADGWIARPTATPEQIAEDRGRIVDGLLATGRDPSRFTFAHENFLHLVVTDDPQEAREEQRRVFAEVMGDGRPFEYFDAVYLTGTPSEIVDKIHRRIDAGIGTMLLHTLVPSTRQLELWVEHLVPRLPFALAAAGRERA